ncbi:MAG: 23S rRNA pseudouridine(2604) synthase RluF [Saprospirales bacterium]|nr:MAG: 23S rRNA pseudouridine(2604) synthase RluF [Saprospirales bacterium]
MKNESGISLNKYISDTGRCSRREADEIIRAGRVLLNGQPAILGNRVFSGDKVVLDGELISGETKPKSVYIALNKPVGIVCTTDHRERDNIIDFVGYPERIFPIGRLDKPSEGLILLTNDGDIVNKILRARNGHEKEYVVSVNKPITTAFLKNMATGVPILDTVTFPCYVEKLDKFQFRIILRQGLNRQIRRMCRHLGYEVTALRRVRIMNITLGRLKSGKWRHLSKSELNELNALLEYSDK